MFSAVITQHVWDSMGYIQNVYHQHQPDKSENVSYKCWKGFFHQQ